MSTCFATHATLVGATADIERLHRLIVAAHALHRGEEFDHWDVHTAAAGYACRRYSARRMRCEPSIAAVLWSEGRDPALDVCILLTCYDEHDGHTFCFDRGAVVGGDADTDPGRAHGDLRHWHAVAAFDGWCVQRSIRLQRPTPASGGATSSQHAVAHAA